MSSAIYGSYSYTDTLKGIYYGPGSLSTALPKLINIIGGRKALIVTGNSLRTKTDVVNKVEAVLKAENAFGGIFSEIGQHAPIAGIQQGIQAFKDLECDFIVAVGGGSPVDASKVILYNLQQEHGGPTLPQIAIPTTLSAAEYQVGAGYTNDDGKKVSVSSQELAPAGIILDAELTLSTPQRLWLSTGIRALDHAVESLYRPLVPPPVKALCYGALADLFKYLPLSKADPNSIEIRQKLQIASWMSLWPTKREKYSALGLSHALGHKLGATYAIPHGITSCLTLSPVVAYMSESAGQEDLEQLARCLVHVGEPSTGTVKGDVKRFSQLIQQLVNDLDLNSNLAEYNVPREDLPSLAEQALGNNADAHDKVVELLEGLYPGSERVIYTV